MAVKKTVRRRASVKKKALMFDFGRQTRDVVTETRTSYIIVDLAFDEVGASLQGKHVGEYGHDLFIAAECSVCDGKVDKGGEPPRVKLGCHTFASSEHMLKFYNSNAKGKSQWCSRDSGTYRPYVKDIVEYAIAVFKRCGINW
jgi:hypothetical protein